MDPIEVLAQFDIEGVLTPMQFTWHGQVHPVTSTGRRWEDDQGRHILVMTVEERIYELVFAPASGRWYMGRSYSSPMVA